MEDTIKNHHSRAAAQEAQDQPSRLLSLLPELRNTIYQFALIEPKGTWIDITPSLKPPALLSTCRQIREECRKIW